MTSSLPHQREQGDLPRRRWRRRLSRGSGGWPPARSALGLRRVLALFGLLFCGVTAVLFARAGNPGAAAFLALLAAVAVVDLVVIHRRAHGTARRRR
ncbi:DUF6343 family protein [Frankia sp. AgB32]|uniref:DUF6343 family protein n=1 Tax=Frankia sp. AgB32 TaxID=631119 RepID=UPI00200E6B9E|nr:DUF6343 family protein [Frankia sp. AgB32]